MVIRRMALFAFCANNDARRMDGDGCQNLEITRNMRLESGIRLGELLNNDGARARSDIRGPSLRRTSKNRSQTSAPTSLRFLGKPEAAKIKLRH